MSAFASLRLPGPAGLAALGLTLAGAACAALDPALYWSLLVAAALLGLAVLAWRHTEAASALWLVLTACTLEMTLLDLAGPDAYQATIAATKAAGLALALLCATGRASTPSTPPGASC